MCKYFIMCKYLNGCTAVGALCTFLCYVCHCASLCNCTVSCATNSSLQALSERLFYYIAVSLLPHNTLCELEAAVEAGRALSPILQWHKHPNDYFSREAQRLYFNSLRTYWQELIDLTRWGMWKSAEYTQLRLKATVSKNKQTNKQRTSPPWVFCIQMRAICFSNFLKQPLLDSAQCLPHKCVFIACVSTGYV